MRDGFRVRIEFGELQWDERDIDLIWVSKAKGDVESDEEQCERGKMGQRNGGKKDRETKDGSREYNRFVNKKIVINNYFY